VNERGPARVNHWHRDKWPPGRGKQKKGKGGCEKELLLDKVPQLGTRFTATRKTEKFSGLGIDCKGGYKRTSILLIAAKKEEKETVDSG